MNSCFIHWVAMLSFFNAQSSPDLARGIPFKLASMFIIILCVSSYFATSYFLAQHDGPCSLCTFPALALPTSSPRSPGFFPWKIVFRNQYLGTRCAHSYCSLLPLPSHPQDRRSLHPSLASMPHDYGHPPYPTWAPTSCLSYLSILPLFPRCPTPMHTL